MADLSHDGSKHILHLGLDDLLLRWPGENLFQDTQVILSSEVITTDHVQWIYFQNKRHCHPQISRILQPIKSIACIQCMKA